ncbi:MAG: hypothetical protein M1334_04935, partial [Patescibacteria group bacterium]|nr:hypothetical protein [Patescibacteria group bacterium]
MIGKKELCPHGNKMVSSRLYDERSQKLEFISGGVYKTLYCCKEPMKRKTVKSTYDCSKYGYQKESSITIAECPCCGKQILDSDINPTIRRFFDWFRQKF